MDPSETCRFLGLATDVTTAVATFARQVGCRGWLKGVGYSSQPEIDDLGASAQILKRAFEHEAANRRSYRPRKRDLIGLVRGNPGLSFQQFAEGHELERAGAQRLASNGLGGGDIGKHLASAH